MPRNCHFCNNLVGREEDRYSYPVCHHCAAAIEEVTERFIRDIQERGNR